MMAIQMPDDPETTDHADPAPAGRSGVGGKLYDALTSAIVTGEIAPGEKLSEPVIARRYGVSRAPVREAIRRLQERGLVSYVTNQGARVAQPSAAEFLALLDVREATEGMAARLAAESMSEAEIAALEALVQGHRGEIERNPAGAYLQDEPEADFHRQIAKGSGNPILAELLCEQFYPRLRLCRRLHSTVPGRGREAWQEHLRITEAISHRDGELAEILMRRHIRAARTALQAALAVADGATPGKRRGGSSVR
ncbi:DNA-binding transcriptional regulator, GntR family OS=Bosea thiooxidans OX=53254 GN=SAMN05660750_03218 PE=4 SV=1 [Bosea thiooxidans]|uniref:DNA-binding transcriptional regulator, GntR family n=2 Tax=Bosea thiooxidans TaxID=53254 RepID=A0A1T5FFK0_9HYPH|nr:DNA-binding transcriptional regulator, GntR family [Bosea thiooxidans]